VFTKQCLVQEHESEEEMDPGSEAEDVSVGSHMRAEKTKASLVLRVLGC
jgi:hypothetical protein